MIFNSKVKNGPMSGNSKFFDGKTKEEIIEDLLKRREQLGKEKGFDGTKIMVPYQNLSKHESGHIEDVTEFVSDTLSDDSNKDLWDYDIPCDIMLIRSNLSGIAIAYSVADCPVVIAETNDWVALAHCGAKEIDRYLPKNVIEGFREKTDAKPDDIKVSVGPCPYEDTYIYETYPNWATNPLWKEYIKEEKDGFHINMRDVIKLQLLDSGIKLSNINFDKRDTISDPHFYSNYGAFHGMLNKNGRHLVGVINNKSK